MFGIPILENGATIIFYDNGSVVKNPSNIELVLNKKYSAVSYHYMRWAMAAEIVTVAWVELQ